MGETRRCKRCREEKEKESFYPVNWGDGRMKVCRDCHNRQVMERRKADIADGSYALYHRQYRARRKSCLE